MALASIIASLLIVTAAYLYVSVRERTFLNVLTPAFVVMIPTEYLLDMYHVVEYGPSNSVYAYLLSYACYAAYTTALALTYVRIRMPALRLPLDGRPAGRSRIPAYLMLAAAVGLYLPILIKFRSQLTDPRAIYLETRTGYGVYFFLSLTLAYLALVLLLFSKRIRKLELFLFVIVCMVFVWLQGSKGHLLGFIFILVLHWVYVKGRRVSFPKFLLVSAGMGVFGIVLFLVTTPDLILGGGVSALANYSQYTRNGMNVIDSGMGPFYGRLTLENQVYARVPRALDPDKPHDFGDFYLAEHFYPDAFVMDTGAPAFGNGAWFADFGTIALPLLLVSGFLNGLLLKMFVTSLRRYRTPGDFVMVLLAAGTPLIPLTSTFLLPESLLLAIVANGLFCLRMKLGSFGGARRAKPYGESISPLA